MHTAGEPVAEAIESAPLVIAAGTAAVAMGSAVVPPAATGLHVAAPTPEVAAQVSGYGRIPDPPRSDYSLYESSNRVITTTGSGGGPVYIHNFGVDR